MEGRSALAFANLYSAGIPARGRITASKTTPERFPLEVQSVSPGPGVGRMDRPGRPQGDNDIVERYKNPNKELAVPRG